MQNLLKKSGIVFGFKLIGMIVVFFFQFLITNNIKIINSNIYNL